MFGLPITNAHDSGVTKVQSYLGSTDEFLLSYQSGNNSVKVTLQEERVPVYLTDSIKEPSSSSGAFRTHSATEFLDENGKPMPQGYFVVVRSFGIQANAVRFRNEHAQLGGQDITIGYHKSTNIYDVFILHTENDSEAYSKRLRQLQKYSNAWVLKLE